MSFIRKKEVWRNLKSGRKMYTYYEEVESERSKESVVQKFIRHCGKIPPGQEREISPLQDTNLQTNKKLNK